MSFFGLEVYFYPVLEFINGFINSYGITVILFTLFIKLLTVPFDIKTRQSTRKMQILQPEIDAINKKYENDPDRKNAKMMELYKREKYNPLSGCLPLLLSMPILFLLLAVLRYTAAQEMKKLYDIVVLANQTGDFSGFHQFMASNRFLWIGNLWQPDTLFMPAGSIIPSADQAKSLGLIIENGQFVQETYVSQMGPLLNSLAEMQAAIDAGETQLTQFLPYAQRTNGLFILPILAGATSFLQSWVAQPKKNPNAAANQAANTGKMMMYIFPVMSVWICSTSNSAFALYWTFSNIYAILLQLVLTYIYNKRDQAAATNKPVPGMPNTY